MRLVELLLTNFRRFSDARIQFGPGLNLVWGPNESGKSTVYDAICCALFGRERGKTVENWNGGPCSVSLTYESGAKVYRIERSFSEAKSRLGVVSGDDLIDVIQTREDVARAIAEHTGVTSRAVFENTVSVRQACMSRLNSADMDVIGGEIQRVLTGTAHVSANEVIRRLEADRDAVRGKARPSNPREYDRVIDQLSRLAEELANVRQSRSRIRNLEDELAELESRVVRDSERVSVLGGLIERYKRWSELKKRESEVDATHREAFANLRRLKEMLSEASRLYMELDGYSSLVGRDDEISAHLAKVDTRRGELEVRLAEMEAAVEGESRSAMGGLVSTLSLTLAIVVTVGGIALGALVNPRFLFLLVLAFALAIKYVQTRSASASSGFAQISGMISSAREEMKQLAMEEESILSYLKCDSADNAWVRIKTYRGLTARAREAEAALNAGLGGKTIAEWEASEAELARRLSSVRREIADGFDGYSPTTEEAESWRPEYAGLQTSLPIALARLHEVRGSLDAERANTRDLAALEGEMEYLHRRKAELEFLHKAYDEAIAALNSVTGTVAEEYLPVLSEQAGEYLREVTSGRYTSLSVKPGWEVTVTSVDRESASPWVLSLGTVDQVYLALRMACGDLLSSGDGLPMVLDDPFASFDRRRVENILCLLRKICRGSQVILMTHDPFILDWAHRLGADGPNLCAVHELPEPASSVQ